MSENLNPPPEGAEQFEIPPAEGTSEMAAEVEALEKGIRSDEKTLEALQNLSFVAAVHGEDEVLKALKDT